MGSRDCAEVSALHGVRFSRAWGAGEFHSLLSQEPVFGFVAARPMRSSRSRCGFVLARHVAGEAEILTIAVNPKLGAPVSDGA